ncbi:MAG: gluconate 2-dehydrogenase subunit 3 family protein [Gemmatimonadaceae bacterium]|nr:gluconate 2-dehydrogenase subunit 3 family protein [Gemmatimonadaceae bacterium]
MDRRDALKAMALLPFAASWDLSAPQIERATRALALATQDPRAPAYVPKFFTRPEWKTVRMLADYVIPRDSRSGSASDAKVPEYIDWLMADKEASEFSRVSMRGGLAWLDLECSERFGKTFVASTDAQRRQVLDDIAWPKKAPPELAHGVSFFNRFRDLTASGFFSSSMGYNDVRFVGNVFNPGWNGCPTEAMAKLGVSQDLMKTRVKPEQT